jgi:glycosyltransferase involved in cell wall biosynthesis
VAVRVSLVALNASGISGIPRYTASLTRGIDTIAHEFPRLELTLVTTRDFADSFPARQIAVRALGPRRRGLPGSLRLVVEQVAPFLARSDVLHFFDVNAPLLAPNRRFVTTFHDASLRRTVASNFAPFRRGYKLRLYPWCLPRADAIVAVSHFAKAEVVRHFGVDSDRVAVIHSGPGLIAPLVTVPSANGGPGKLPAFERPYLLFVGNLTASKNVPFLVRAYQQAGVPVDLVLAGRPLEDMEAITRTLRETRPPQQVHLVAEPTDAEIARLYDGATAFVFPSLYEGFGFPPLEAMAHGCPVLASDIPSLREVSGAGAMLVPLNEMSWAESIRRVVADQRLRDDLRERGLRNVNRYSWQETARGVCGLLESVGSARSRDCAPLSGSRPSQ